MMDVAFVAPVSNAAVRTDGFEYNLLFGLTDGKYQQYLMLFRNIQMLPEGFPVYGRDHTAAQSFLPGTQKYGLAGNTVIAAGIVADFGII
jgi:hypothetical protein